MCGCKKIRGDGEVERWKTREGRDAGRQGGREERMEEDWVRKGRKGLKRKEKNSWGGYEVKLQQEKKIYTAFTIHFEAYPDR